MKLKKLEIVGFKSFRDKLALDFSSGISAIVGPNGCGKSNIVDAIRWVMGEQRLKMLRAKKMEDTIFNGTDNAPSVGMAEVSMILSANGRRFPGEYGNCSEVMISRRTYRDGESEYSLNKVPCRLLDVREFLMDIGIGVRTYSLVEQNHIANLIEARPEDRRKFIEEAAGIAKYKNRKEAASRKMDSTRQNIIRLNDITREVKTQLNSISRQAKKAEKYKTLKKSVKEAELAFALQTYSDLAARHKSLEEARDAITVTGVEIGTKLRELEASIEQIKTETLENEGLISELQEELYEIKNEINIKEQGIEFSKGKIADISERKQKNMVEIEMLRGRKENTIEEANTLQARITESDKRIADVTGSVTKSQKVVEEQKEMESTIHRELEERKVEQVDILTEKARLKNMLADLSKRSEDLKSRSESYNREIEENTEKVNSVNDSLSNLKSSLESDMERFEYLSEKEGVITGKLEKAESDSHIIDKRIAKFKEETGMKSSRLFSLKEFQEGYKWCNEGTRSIMKAKKQENLCGLVADYIEVPKEYEVAVEAVLGEKLQYIIVKSQEDGIEAIDYLRSHSLGRSSFVPIEVRNKLSGVETLHENVREVVRLTDVVSVKEGFEGIANYLLGNVLLIPNLNTGISLWRRNGFEGTFVTPEGDVVNPHGVLTGGSGENGERSLLRNKREIAELEEEIDNLNNSLKNEEVSRARTGALISQCEEELAELSSELRDLELSINSRRKDIERFEGEQKWIEQRINVLVFNRESLVSEEARIMEKIAATEGEIISHKNRKEVANETISSLQERWEELRGKLEGIERELTREKVLLAALDEKKHASLKTLARLSAAATDISNDINSKTGEAEALETEIEDITKTIALKRDHLDQLYSDHDTCEVELEKKRELQSEKIEILRSREMEAREIKKDLDNLTKKASGLEMESREVSLQANTLKEGMHRKYYVDLDSLKTEFTKFAESDIQELQNKLDRDREAIENFGEVNLLALSEHETLKERYDFLTSQVADLNSSLDVLQRTISRINRISRKRFSETFTGVNRCFKEVFSRLFQGGKGELKLTDEADMLETGVDIDIQLPGKKTQNISLLSGGEKSLAAVALIFSILLYRPIPFLILDEVDAALDDVNISLFNKLVKDISAHSQIILVTHNKRTMEVADNLIGVTMAKQGISTTVSVSLH